MSATEIATIVALLLNAGALGVVAYQTSLTRKSLIATDRAVGLSVKTIQVEMLPNANWVITVRVSLEGWRADLQETAAACRDALEGRDSAQVKALAGRGLMSPRGLVKRYSAEHMPSWLSTIWLAAAQYYYNAKSAQPYLWRADEDGPDFRIVPDFVTRCEHSIRGLDGLLELIGDVVPDVYSESPASLNDDRFYD